LHEKKTTFIIMSAPKKVLLQQAAIILPTIPIMFALHASFSCQTVYNPIDWDPESLLATEAMRLKSKFPENRVTCDLYSLRFRPKDESLDYIVGKFFNSPLFRLERWILRKVGAVDPAQEATPVDKLAVGDKMDLWTVTARDDANKEILLSWSSPLFPFTGASFIKVRRVNNIAIQVFFGSILNVPPDVEVSSWTFRLHTLYSKLLLRRVN
jgi:hypothetical protein